MAERKSVNKYYPPDWDPSKGSVNKYVGQHPLRDRARKLSQGILVIRFEMPYNIWCGGCNSHIGMGVRYNAEKTKTGMYYSTPIYKFRMKCHLCPNYFEIQTDPKNHDYVILEGARRKEQRWDPKENEQIVPEDRATHKKMATDAMFKLEHGSDDHKKGRAVVMNLSNLEGKREEWKDDYILNKIARQKFREEKKTIKSSQDSDAALLNKSSLEIPLVKEVDEDKRLAQLMKYRTVESYDEKQAQKRKEIESRPIFQSSKVPKLDLTSPDSKKLNIIRKHLKTVGNKSSPFDSGTRQSSSKSGIDKLNLGIRKKTDKPPVSQPNEDSDTDNEQLMDISQDNDKTVTDGTEVGKSIDITADVHSVNNTESSKSVDSDKIDQIDSDDIKEEKTDGLGCDETENSDIGDCDKYARSLISVSELKPTIPENNRLSACKNLENVEGSADKKDLIFTEEDAKPYCDSKPICVDDKSKIDRKAESCDIKHDSNVKTEDKTESEASSDKDTLIKNLPEVKVDAKKLSLVAPYSDSESDSSSELS